MTESERAATTGAVTTVTHGEVTDEAVAYSLQRIGHLARLTDEPILFQRIKLSMASDPARRHRAIAQGTIDVNGRIIRAHVAADEMHEAIDLLQSRLSEKLSRQRREPGGARGSRRPMSRPDVAELPRASRQLVRRKAFVATELTADEAAFDMEQLDYDFYLFRDLGTDQDSVLERLPGGTYRLRHLRGSDLPPPAGAYSITREKAQAATLSVEEALAELEMDGSPFVFFASPDTGRGNVVYRRYDGHYGLISLEEASEGAK